jgi:hypothetical protein
LIIPLLIAILTRHHPPDMSSVPVKRTATAGADAVHAVKPNNPLQSDFNADDTSSMDEDERYLVR